MLKLTYPKGNFLYYAWLEGQQLIGPLKVGESDVFETIPLEFGSSIEEKKGIFHENDVSHWRYTGDVYYLPKISMQSSPTSNYPHRAVGTATIGGVSKPITVRLYPVIPETSGIEIQGVGRTSCISAWNQDGNVWTKYSVNYYGYDSYRVSAIVKTQYTYLNTDLGLTSCSFSYRSWEVLLKKNYSINWASEPSFTVVRDFVESKIPTNPTVSGSTGGACAQFLNVGNPTQDGLIPILNLHRDILVYNTIEDIDFGYLAKDAIGQLNVCDVNMLEFIRDLRHPRELIPKLKNLKKIKTLANNYLLAKYGILPTVDDINAIISSFQKVGPYIDTNGFSVHAAKRLQTLEKDDYIFSSEQHLKLALSRTDEEFGSLWEQLVRRGYAPTLENLWDLVPYSFIIDWLGDVGGLLERVDCRQRLQRFPYKYVTMSYHHIAQHKLGARFLPYYGTINREHYNRWVTGHCPVPPYSAEHEPSDFNHWIEAGALIVSRSK